MWSLVEKMNKIQKISARLRNHKKYRLWIQQIRERDGDVCFVCEVMGVPGAIERHHMVPFQTLLEIYKIQSVNEALDCEFFWDNDNGLSVCSSCHRKLHLTI